MSDLPDPQESFEQTSSETVFPAGDKRIVFGARKPTEEVSPLTPVPFIIEAPFPYERTLQWLPTRGSWQTEVDPQVVIEETDDLEPSVSTTRDDDESSDEPSSGVLGDGNTNVVVSQEVLIKVNEHVSQTLDRELGGFLLGNRYRCPNTACDYVIIDQYSPAKFTESNEVRLAFTHDAWAQISDELSGKFLGKLLIGWYHSHPRLDVFLSSHDMEIQSERFPEPWMVALVLEPEKHHGGFFCSRDGRVNPNSPVDFFELLERNSRDSVIAWENYRALDPSTSSTPVLSTTNTATPTNYTSQELLEVRAKQIEKAPPRQKRRGRLFVFAAVVLVLLGAAAVGFRYRKRIGAWWQQRTATIPAIEVAEPSPSAEQAPVPQPETTPAPSSTSTPESSPAPTSSPVRAPASSSSSSLPKRRKQS
jgi:proteasome lid subunit RPN8/RPN11